MTVRKKIFDITPPQKVMREELKGKPPEEKSVKTPRVFLEDSSLKSDVAKKPISGKNLKLIPLFAVLVILLALASGYFLIPPKADVELWPQKKSIEETAQIVISAARKGANFIPGDILKEEKVVSRDFAVQGKKLKAVKAQGTIRVYNNYSAVSQALLTTTRFVSDDGKLFRAPKSAVIPGGHYEGGKLVAGFIDIEVVADQPGQEYNINASTFSIPGFAGTSKYTSFYAKSFEPMKGGSKEMVAYLTQDDLNRAKDALAKIALAESETALRSSIFSGGYELIDKAISVKADGFKTSAELGQEIDNFSAQTKATAKAAVFKGWALTDFSRNYILGKLLPEEKLIESSLKTEYSLEKADLEKDELVLKLAISAKSHAAPGEVQLKEMIKNKSFEEVESILKGFPQIERAEVEFWPFWIIRSPDDLESINIALRLD